jgi:hypothetical protein
MLVRGAWSGIGNCIRFSGSQFANVVVQKSFVSDVLLWIATAIFKHPNRNIKIKSNNSKDETMFVLNLQSGNSQQTPASAQECCTAHENLENEWCTYFIWGQRGYFEKSLVLQSIFLR